MYDEWKNSEYYNIMVCQTLIALSRINLSHSHVLYSQKFWRELKLGSWIPKSPIEEY